MNISTQSLMDHSRKPVNKLEKAGQVIEQHICLDTCTMALCEKFGFASGQQTSTLSGTAEHDYCTLMALSRGLVNVNLIKSVTKTPLPPEVMEHFGHMKCNCMMGIFEDIGRAWLVVDSDIYLWSFEYNAEIICYDGLSETIVSVGFATPKEGMFQSCVQHLMILTTTYEIVVIGVSVSTTDTVTDLNFVPEPLFTLPTDGATINTVTSTNRGRIFLGGKDGSVYETTYRPSGTWFGKRFKKVNHSASILTYIVPALLSPFIDSAAIVLMSVDTVRNILYALRENNTIECYDLGEDGSGTKYVASVSRGQMLSAALLGTLALEDALPIVSLAALDPSECSYIHLMATAQNGLRLYFTTGGNSRPYMLQLVHTRFPPGYAPNTMYMKPATVHNSVHKKGTSLMVSSSDQGDVLTCLSSDMFPFHSQLIETYSKLQLDGPTWAIAEIQRAEDCMMAFSDPIMSCTPVVVTQHLHSPRRWLVLSPHGANVISLLRPVDVLRQLLYDCQGPANEAVRAYFQSQSETQACATCLVLACLDPYQNQQLVDWATQAFFMYGGEPTVIPGMGANMGPNITAAPQYMDKFNPRMVSTPMHGTMGVSNVRSAASVQQSLMSPGSPFMAPRIEPEKPITKFSSKFIGLNFYLSRLLRPIWRLKCVHTIQTEAKKTLMVSNLSQGDCDYLLRQLYSLLAFLEQKMFGGMSGAAPQRSSKLHGSTFHETSVQNVSQSGAVTFTVDPQVEERASLENMMAFLAHTCEVIGLWKILCEHQFHILIQSIPQDQQDLVKEYTFKDLLILGTKTCVSLILALINAYLQDSADVDSISSKLRDICPNLYRDEDAACSKANEILLKVKDHQIHEEDRTEMIQTALDLCKKVAPNLPLESVCQQFAVSHAYYAVVDLCSLSAKKIDPNDIAMHHYNKETTESDDSGIMSQRMSIYQNILLILDKLLDIGNRSPLSVGLPSQPGPPQAPSNLSVPPEHAAAHIKQIINLVLQSDDQLMQVALYEWMLQHDLLGDILSVTQPSLGMFLARVAKPGQAPESLGVVELLWKYHEMHGRHSTAATILYDLAVTPSNKINLTQRMSYMGRAVMCLRSASVGYSVHDGVFMRDVEDKLEVAAIQQKVVDSVIALNQDPADTRELLNALNYKLYDITQLYEEFAEPLGLWEVKLAILNCSDHNDPMLVESAWKNIIEQHMPRTVQTKSEKMDRVILKIKPLIKEYVHSSNCMPLGFIVKQLEILSCRLEANKGIVPTTLIEAGVSIQSLLDVYKRLLLLNDRVFLHEGNELHLVEAGIYLVNYLIANQNTIPSNERRHIISTSEDFIARCLAQVLSKSSEETDRLANVLSGLQTELTRMY